MKKILVLYARYGSGHKSIAEYVASYIKENNKNYDVNILDITDYANIPGKFGVKIMEFVAKYRPEKIFDFCYKLSDNEVIMKSNKLATTLSYDNKDLRATIARYNPDVCISTLFYCSNIIAKYNDLGLINSKIFTIITDYHSHSIWTMNHEKEDGFIVANNLVKQELINRGINRKKIHAYGLPMKNSDNLKDVLEIKNKYHVNNGKKVILFFGGSSTGSMYYYNYFKILARKRLNVNIICICGNNIKLKGKCQSLIKEENITNVKVLGFTKDVFNLLKISDLVITKPGGATLTECLEYKVPLLLVPGVGGQEKWNANFIVKKKYGIYVKSKRKFKRVIDIMFNNPKYINRMKKRLEMQSENNSLEKINQLVRKI